MIKIGIVLSVVFTERLFFNVFISKELVFRVKALQWM